MNEEMRAFEAHLEQENKPSKQGNKTMKTIKLLPLLLVLASCGKGDVGVKGIKGDKGLNGQSCYSEIVNNGINVICGDDTHFISDGSNGQDGEDGTFQGYFEYRTVCPTVNPNDYMETLLYLDGKYLAFLSAPNWNDQRLTLLSEDKLYETTDGRAVEFTIIGGELQCL